MVIRQRTLLMGCWQLLFWCSIGLLDEFLIRSLSLMAQCPDMMNLGALKLGGEVSSFWDAVVLPSLRKLRTPRAGLRCIILWFCIDLDGLESILIYYNVVSARIFCDCIVSSLRILLRVSAMTTVNPETYLGPSPSIVVAGMEEFLYQASALGQSLERSCVPSLPFLL